MFHKGFTLTELVMVIVITGIMAAVVLPRFASKSDFEQSGFRDQTVSALQFARKVAVASRRYTCVTITAASVTLRVDPRLAESVTPATATCTVNLNTPGGSSPALTAPASVTLGAVSFNFDPQGQASTAASISITGGRAIRVESSGYVY